MYSRLTLCQYDSERLDRKWLVDGESDDNSDAQSISADTADEEYDSIGDLEEFEETDGHGWADAVDGNASASKRRRISTGRKWSRRDQPKKRRILLNEVSMQNLLTAQVQRLLTSASSYSLQRMKIGQEPSIGRLLYDTPLNQRSSTVLFYYMLDTLSVILGPNGYVWISAASHFPSVHTSTPFPKVSHHTVPREVRNISSHYPIR